METEVIDTNVDTEVETEVAEIPSGEKRKVAHMHKADKRANQRGPVTDYNVEVGRQKQEPCYETRYHVKHPVGLKINEKMYSGTVVVPECVANYLTMMDSEWEKSERNLFRNNPTALNVAQL